MGVAAHEPQGRGINEVKMAGDKLAEGLLDPVRRVPQQCRIFRHGHFIIENPPAGKTGQKSG